MALSTRDGFVLEALFDAEGTPRVQASSKLAKKPVQYDANDVQRDILHDLNESSPSLESVQAAIARLTALIARWPGAAALYVDRAQATRLQSEVSDLFTCRTHKATLQILEDLNRAISLATDSPLTEHTRRILASAHGHRGFLYLKAAGMKQRNEASFCTHDEIWASYSAKQLEELASKDFAIGARNGSAEAKAAAVATNPYASMCGAIVKQAMDCQIEDWHDKQ